VSVAPNKKHRDFSLETSEEIAFFRAREEALDLQVQREKHEAERNLFRQGEVRGRVEIGHLRFSLIERVSLAIFSVISSALSMAFGAIGLVSLWVSLLLVVALGIGYSGFYRRRSPHKPHQQLQDDQRLKQ
jgi:hypothetical protein